MPIALRNSEDYYSKCPTYGRRHENKLITDHRFGWIYEKLLDNRSGASHHDIVERKLEENMIRTI